MKPEKWDVAGATWDDPAAVWDPVVVPPAPWLRTHVERGADARVTEALVSRTSAPVRADRTAELVGG